LDILKETDIERRERRLVRKLYMDHSVKLRMDQWETRRVKTGKAVRHLRCLSRVLSSLYRAYFTKGILEVFGYLNLGGQVIHTVKRPDDSALLAKKNRRWNWKSCGTGMNVREDTKVMRISRQPFPVLFMIDQKQRENVEYFSYMGSSVTNDARCTREI
jgi:hypothetical protein